MTVIMQICYLIIIISFASGCTINQFRQSHPQSVYGDGWNLSQKWNFINNVVTVTGHGLEFDIYAHNEDKVSELWIPQEGWHKMDPFIISAYIIKIKDGITVDWNRMKIISNGVEYAVKELIGPYNIPKYKCNPNFTSYYGLELKTYQLSNTAANTCVFLKFNANNSDIGWYFDSELSKLKDNDEILPNLRILWGP